MSNSPLYDLLRHAHDITRAEADRLGLSESLTPATPSVFGITFLGAEVEVSVKWRGPILEQPPCDCCWPFWKPWTPRFRLRAGITKTNRSEWMETVIRQLLGHPLDRLDLLLARWEALFGSRDDMQTHLDGFEAEQTLNPLL